MTFLFSLSSVSPAANCCTRQRCFNHVGALQIAGELIPFTISPLLKLRASPRKSGSPSTNRSKRKALLVRRVYHLEGIDDPVKVRGALSLVSGAEDIKDFVST